jgi:thiol-disulfide isomerase/thioredoxin
MPKLSRYRVLMAGVLSVPAAAALGILTYGTLTRASSNVNQDFVFRLTAVTLAMTLPFLGTLALAMSDRRRGGLTLGANIGLVIATLSLGLTFVPLRGLVGRMQQVRNTSISGVKAPLFDTVDLNGMPQRLQDHRGEVILVNAWATWCPPCREEMPLLDELYRKQKQDGLIVFGLSTEEIELQKKFVTERVPVSYPLLTMNGTVPAMYHEVQRWPALFLIDRQGRLRPVAQSGEPFAKVEAAVDELLGTAP